MENQEEPERTEVSTSVRELLIKKHKEGMSLRSIGNLVGRTHSTIQTIISNCNKTGSAKFKQLSGRPRVFTDREENIIVRKVKQNPRLTLPQIASEMLEETNKTSSRFTVGRVLERNGYRNYRARKKPFISERNRKK
ncbi:hypothetical protein ILUMI_03829 [Ignelater luminosus]|uniref:Transposase Tc1-like domain-containing protein n=1 Tax=Ignelater luminosus TaxID=2038154 RepID=A0A8K0GHY1_IGNLU|nr:hypothetical protein ILUMI_03829 [Ignelater luminosus]